MSFLSSRRHIAVILKLLSLSVGFNGVTAEPSQAAVRHIRVRVTEVAADRAYLSRGKDRGLKAGVLVRFGRQRYRVIAATEHNAVIQMTRRRRVREGQRGRATVETEKRQQVTGPENTKELSAYRGQWKPAQKPAAAQSPKFVPIGETGVVRKNRLMVSAGLSALGSFRGDTDPILRTELRGQLHAEPFEAPFTVDADASLQTWSGRDLSYAGTRSRPLLRVRQLEIAYGRRDDFYAGIGRLRSAAAPIGMVDGGRLQSPSLGGFTVAAFGGMVPDPMEGTPDVDVSRFGGELAYQDMDSEWKPMAGIVGHGSMYMGRLDERRLNIYGNVFPGTSMIGVHGELSFYDGDNPWNRSAAELTMAGINASTRIGAWNIGGRLDMRRPERSYWLDSFFPRSWLCPQTAQAASSPPVAESCAAADATRYASNLFTGFQFDTWSITAGGNVIVSEQNPTIGHAGGYLTLRWVRLLEIVHADLTASSATTSVIQNHAIRAGAGVTLWDGSTMVDVYYRPGMSQYRSEDDPWVDQSFGTWTTFAFLDHWDLLVGLDAFVSQDVDAWLAQSMLRWRPLL